jgi:POT family proton-dependent oligopeptide transporter
MHNPEDRSFLGHPRGLGYLAFTEAWERFSYYGMQSLLVLYMVNRLLHPGHIEVVAGFGPFRHLLDNIYRGPLSAQARASRRLPSPPPSLASIIWPSLGRIISSAGSAGFSK